MLLKCLLNLGFRLRFSTQCAINSVSFISTYLLLHFFLPLAFLAFPFIAYFIYLSVTVIYVFLILRFSPSPLLLFFLSYPSPVSNTTSLPLPYLNPLPIFPSSTSLTLPPSLSFPPLHPLKVY